MSVQIVAVALAYAALPAWAYWEFTIWHRRRRGILPSRDPAQTQRRRRR